MPKNVRNFWIETEVDGRGSLMASGPASLDGGFSCRIYVRREGMVDDAVTIRGIANPDGTLEIRVQGVDEQDNNVGRFTVQSRR